MENEKFVILVNRIKKYNKNLNENGEETMLKFKLYEFLFDCLLHCKIMPVSDINSYLEFVEKEFNKLDIKRSIGIFKAKHLHDPLEAEHIR